MDKLQIGDVKYSVLPPEAFTNIHGKEWALAAGQETYAIDGRSVVVSKTKLGKLLQIDRLPDARGMFIRGVDDGRLIDTDHGRNVEFGSNDYQKDTTRIPRERRFTGETGKNGAHTHRYGNTKEDVAASSYHAVNDAQNEGSFETSKNGLHQHELHIDGGGDQETRPVNIAMYVYIKVN